MQTAWPPVNCSRTNLPKSWTSQIHWLWSYIFQVRSTSCFDDFFFLQIFGACPTNRWGGVQQDKFPGSKNREIFIYHNYTTVASSRTLNGTDIPYKSHHSFKTRCITINSNQPLLTASHWQKLLLIISAHGFFFCYIYLQHFILSFYTFTVDPSCYQSWWCLV